MANYNRDDIIRRLEKNGLKAIYRKDKKFISHFKKPKSGKVGIKCWGYLDYLGVKAV